MWIMMNGMCLRIRKLMPFQGEDYHVLRHPGRCPGLRATLALSGRHGIVPNIFHNVIPNIFHNVVPNIFHNVVPNIFHNVVPNIFHNVVPNIFHKIVPNTTPKIIPNIFHKKVPITIHKIIPNTIPNKLRCDYPNIADGRWDIYGIEVSSNKTGYWKTNK